MWGGAQVYMKKKPNASLQVTGGGSGTGISALINGATDISTLPTLSWNASSGATSYTLQVSENSNFTSFVYNQSGLTGISQQINGTLKFEIKEHRNCLDIYFL